MRKTDILSVLALAALVLLTAGCRAPAPAGTSAASWAAADAEPAYTTEWPENEYTAKIVKPAHGEMDYVLDYASSGRFGLVLKDISEAESEEYVDALKDYGYSELLSEEGDVSVGTMLEKEGVILSVSYSESAMAVLITIADAE